ncbi:Zn(2)-C6 fungal-type DNA-binding domain protein [Metarhizium guizhouense ARSEF 977]|uniref:Zn(2)-C6 fungal-type DNA-binding domain protein n=1 Tax=Metarhizium guizhouense (strain ARSEF 977) TaxID=1276136 RepID=A0A0B4HYR5_METGA|nr:Zn(2)-C6 fungal-type DNA-binding domain protein [Metarhizium guizhouense ARSEF 977]
MSKRPIASISTAQAADREAPSDASENAHKNPRPMSSSHAPPHTSSAKRRIKCELLTERPPCERCKRRNIECVINTGLRNSILDQRQLAVLGRDLSKVHATLETVCQQLGVELPKPLELAALSSVGTGPGMQDGDLDDGEDGLYEPSQHNSPSAVPAPIDAYLTKPESEPSAPGPATASASRSYKKPDIISKGLITIEDAEVLVNHYFVEMDPILYGFVNTHSTTHGVRDGSPALIAAICTVSSLHLVDYGHLFETCYREYRHVIATTLFERQDVEHIRALLVGSFWLPGASRILLCDAVRRAGDVRLHRHIFKAINGLSNTSPSLHHGSADQNQSRDCVSLWYGIFMSDQHQAILNNRESLLPLHIDVLEKRGEYMANEACTNHDLRLVAQSSLLLAMARIKSTLGSEYPTPVPESRAAEFVNFSAELDAWIDEFRPKFQPSPEMGKFPPLAFQLHYLFGKLYLGHHVFRGLQGRMIPEALLEAARMAYDAAVAIFRMILDADGLLCNLWRVPGYIHIMISFAGHLLLELCIKHRDQLGINVEQDYRMLNAVVSALTNIRLNPAHPLRRVASGLQKRLFEFAAQYGKESLIDNGTDWPRQQGKEASMTASASAGGVAQETTGPLCEMGATGMPDDFFFTDFSDFTFQDPSVDFMGV